MSAYGSRNPSQMLLAEVFVLKRAAGKLPYPLADHYGAFRRDFFQPRREIHRLEFTDGPFAVCIDHHQAAGDRHANLQYPVMRQGERANRFDNLQSRVNCSPRVVFVSGRITKESNDFLAVALEDATFEPGDDSVARVVVRTNDRFEYFRIPDFAG